MGWAKEIASKPELGFKETRTSEFIHSVFNGLGFPTRSGIALTGVKGVLEGIRSGPGLLLMGEMGAVVNRESSIADPVTGAAHLCGHLWVTYPQSKIGNPHLDGSLFPEPPYLLFADPQKFTQDEFVVLSHQG